MADRNRSTTKASKIEWQRLALACQIGAADTAVALALSVHAEDAELIASPGVRRLAHELKLSEQTVRRSLVALRELRLIIRVESGSTAKVRAQADRYKLAIPPDLEERVEVQPEPASAPAGRGRGGMANHIRWHERRSRLVATCIHCVESIAPEAIVDQQHPAASASTFPIATSSPDVWSQAKTGDSPRWVARAWTWLGVMTSVVKSSGVAVISSPGFGGLTFGGVGGPRMGQRVVGRSRVA